MRYQPDAPDVEGATDRAGSRTPMQWELGPTAGFSTCAVNPSAASVSASIPTLSAPVEAIARSGKVKYKRGATTDRIVMGPVSAVVYRLSRP